MATRTEITIVDDITGEEGATTHRISIDAVNYEIDLIDDTQLVAALAPYVTAGRRVSSAHRTPGGTVTSKTDKAHNVTVRTWAIEQGLITASTRGRLAGSIHTAYNNAHA